MAVRIGFHLEGHDWLIVRALMAAILQLPEEQIDPVTTEPGGWQNRLNEDVMRKAVQKFYRSCTQAAVVGVDNDGDRDLNRENIYEDPAHPRHWNHETTVAGCRRCVLDDRVRAIRRNLASQNPLPMKPVADWPIVIAVPVEAIEAWLLAAEASVSPGKGNLTAERLPRSRMKFAFYGAPQARLDLVQSRALPVIRQLADADIDTMRKHSRSFDDFASQVLVSAPAIMGSTDCHAPGDGLGRAG